MATCSCRITSYHRFFRCSLGGWKAPLEGTREGRGFPRLDISGATIAHNLKNPHALNGTSLGDGERVRYGPACWGLCCPLSKQSSVVLSRLRGIAWKLPNGWAMG